MKHLAIKNTLLNWELPLTGFWETTGCIKQSIIHVTGGCYDGLEDSHVNINQGAESAISYLMARLTVEKYRNRKRKPVIKKMYAV